MNQIKSKIYYEISTGKVIIKTSECEGHVNATTKDQDIEFYLELKNYTAKEVDFIELEYGTSSNTFNNAKSYKVNLETRQLEVIYYSKEEIESMNQQIQEVEKNSSRVSDISTYLLNSDETTIMNIENSILEIEKNKILEGTI